MILLAGEDSPANFFNELKGVVDILENFYYDREVEIAFHTQRKEITMYDQGYTPQPKSNTSAIIALVLGIISVLIGIVGCCVFRLVGGGIGTILGVVAFIMGLVARKKIKDQGGQQSQLKMATAAFILGIVGSIFGFVNLLIGLIINLSLLGPSIENLFQDTLDQIEMP